MLETQLAHAQVTQLIEELAILVADGNQHMRKTTRMMLTNIGAKSIFEVDDGVKALEAIRTLDPDVMILDWNIPVLSAAEMMRIIRSPGVFPKSSLPIIMVATRGTRSVVQDSLRLGAHELLVKPTSPKALQQRLVNIFLAQRPMVRAGKFYIPKPRRQVDWALIDVS
ncbi:MAG TPA: response regulator [Xanthobacteraceae bacterium]|nr:response regulator [Xanthobacteraceae bacterium]